MGVSLQDGVPEFPRQVVSVGGHAAARNNLANASGGVISSGFVHQECLKVAHDGLRGWGLRILRTEHFEELVRSGRACLYARVVHCILLLLLLA